MMKKNRTIYFLLALVCLGLQSCLFQEEDYFDDSSANRATADVKRCSELLEAAPNGWVMEYYVGKDYSLGGITLLCKFDGQRVTMASQIAGADETVSSLYSVKSEQATMLSFDTYNYLVHYFGQPQGSMADDPNGTLGGDYEFVISDATADRIELKGKKYGNRIVMKAFSADQTWKQYLTRIKKVEDDAFFYEYDLRMDGLYTGQMLRSNYTFIVTYYDEVGKVHQKTVPFMFTTDGMRFHEPVTIDGQTMQNFVWKNEEISFVCTDEGATEVKLAGVYTAGYQSYDYYPGTYQMDFYRLNDATNQMEVASQEIQLVKDEDGKSYWLKGLEYDILVTYDKPCGGLSILPQFLKKVQGGYVYLAMWDLMNDYVLRSSAIGLISYPTTDGIYLVDNGVWMGEISGFIFGVYDSQDEEASFMGYTDAVAAIRLIKKTIEE
ncbi:DUF4302 domain-containing protein [Bacteroides ovatus]|uniref:DUF4302 domain-containing protein n=1 Tax=Bacteroides ovatus TaxID=28116 RepID=UPI0020A71CAA|nr:DUF4302 domain-containing protein [Bacteroides ovatus]CAG9879555.1 hypothetical protein BOVA115_3582 [Bacteroides ovatus]